MKIIADLTARVTGMCFNMDWLLLITADGQIKAGQAKGQPEEGGSGYPKSC